jgi:hypothetical protein
MVPWRMIEALHSILAFCRTRVSFSPNSFSEIFSQAGTFLGAHDWDRVVGAGLPVHEALFKGLS